LIKYFLLVVT